MSLSSWSQAFNRFEDKHEQEFLKTLTCFPLKHLSLRTTNYLNHIEDAIRLYSIKSELLAEEERGNWQKKGVSLSS